MFAVTRNAQLLAPQLMLEMARRVCPNQWLTGERNKQLARAAWTDAGYCLDAPDELPAGGCHMEWADAENGCAMQMTVERETPNDEAKRRAVGPSV
jgi:hypothetical protein